LKTTDFGSSVLAMISRLEGRGAKLSLPQKLLLAETGTVEQVLSILVQAPVQVSVVEQTAVNGIIKRKVAISKKGSDRPLIVARSKVYTKSLPTRIVWDIMQEKGGIGTILHNAGIETHRRLVRFGLDNGHPYRVYRIIHRGKVAFEIREDIMI
jgi:chorismate-pyruvate lyase